MDHKYKRCKENPGGLVNTDAQGLVAYKSKKKQQQKIEKLENDVKEIKELLLKIVGDNK